MLHFFTFLEIPDHVDPPFRIILTPCSGDVDPSFQEWHSCLGSAIY
jgi:hypothetical protein